MTFLAGFCAGVVVALMFLWLLALWITGDRDE